jgi:zinc D-Ala-D-Ala carboxypeptidase
MVYLNKRDLACKCGCGLENATDLLLQSLEKLADMLGRCPVPTSGSRCPKHNEEEGGEKDSAHLAGEAVDLACPSSWARLILVRALIACGFTRIGIGKTFVHADVSSTLPQKVMWLY